MCVYMPILLFEIIQVKENLKATIADYLKIITKVNISILWSCTQKERMKSQFNNLQKTKLTQCFL